MGQNLDANMEGFHRASHKYINPFNELQVLNMVLLCLDMDRIMHAMGVSDPISIEYIYDQMNYIYGILMFLF